MEVASTDGWFSKNDFRLELFDELCISLEAELEHSLFTSQQIHQKMIFMDKSPDKSLVYSRKHLQNMLVDRYQEKMYFTSQKRQTDVMCFKRYTSASNFTSQKRQTDVMYFKRYMSASIIREYHGSTEDDDKTKSSTQLWSW